MNVIENEGDGHASRSLPVPGTAPVPYARLLQYRSGAPGTYGQATPSWVSCTKGSSGGTAPAAGAGREAQAPKSCVT